MKDTTLQDRTLPSTSAVAALAQRVRRERRARLAVSATVAVLLAIVWSHSLAGLLRAFAPETALLGRTLTVVSLVVALTGTLCRSAWITAAFGTLAVAWIQAFSPGSLLVSLALPVACTAAVAVGLWLGERLPKGLGKLVARRKLLAAWLVLAALSVIQVGRLSTWMTDPDFDWFGTTRHAFWAKHECLPAYVYGAELVERGDDNPWLAAHYPGLNPEAQPVTRLEAIPVEDPYQYTPQFLLLPSLAIHWTHHYPAIRLAWYGLQTTLFLGVALWLAAWVAGRSRRQIGVVAAYFLPLTLLAIPTLHSLQYGQFHLATLALAVAGLLCLDSGRRVAGGGLLASAILAKIFPLVLLLPLAVQRRWRDLASVAAWGSAVSLLALGVFGPAVFGNFFSYHLPRLGSGDAFAFGVAWPEVRELVIAANHGAYGLVAKLGEMGMPGMTEFLASLVGKLYFFGVFVLAAVLGIKLQDAPRIHRAVAWLSLLGLASMASAGAFADYVPVAFAWLLPFLLVDMARSRVLAGFYAVVAFFQFSLLGAAPWGTWAPPEWTMPLSALSVVLLFAGYGVALRAVWTSRQPARVEDDEDCRDLGLMTAEPSAA